eukprot:5728410-Amphidinium_carterae.1
MEKCNPSSIPGSKKPPIVGQGTTFNVSDCSWTTTMGFSIEIGHFVCCERAKSSTSTTRQ